MKILFVNHTAAIGGGERSLLDLMTALRDDPEAEIILAVLAPGPLVEMSRGLGFDTRIIPMPRNVREIRRARFSLNPLFLATTFFKLIPLVLRLIKIIVRERIQIVYTNSPKAHVPGALAARLTFRKVVCHYRDRFDPGRTSAFFVKAVGILAHRVIVNSRYVAEPFWAIWWIQNKVHVIYNGIDPERLPSTEHARDQALERFNLPSHAILIGMVGRLDHWKGQEYFIRAGAIITRKEPSARLLVIGGPSYDDPDYLQSLRDLAQSLELGDKIIFTGYLQDVMQVMAGLDVVVHASFKAEPFGRVLIEAMALSKPVVAADLGGPREIVLQGETGYLVPPRDFEAMAEAVLRIVWSPDRRIAMGDAGRERQHEFFHINKTKTRVLETLRELI